MYKKACKETGVSSQTNRNRADSSTNKHEGKHYDHIRGYSTTFRNTMQRNRDSLRCEIHPPDQKLYLP